MEFKQSEWIGKWTNFESYIYSNEAAMQKCWADAEQAAKVMPMFKNGVKAFWEASCKTINEENPQAIGGWNIMAKDTCMEIEWLDADGEPICKYQYIVDEVIAKGLEGTENFLFKAVDTDNTSPFKYLLAMEPMPNRSAKENGGLLSHLHFQYASSKDLLLKDGKLCKPMWYPTMCDAEGNLLDRCNIVRALHRLPLWEQLPE